MHKSFNLQVFLLHSPVFFDSRFFGHDKVFIPPYWDSDMSFMYFIKFTGHGIQNNLWRKRELSIRKTLARLKPLITCQCFGIDKTVFIYSTTLYYHFFFLNWNYFNRMWTKWKASILVLRNRCCVIFLIFNIHPRCYRKDTVLSDKCCC